MLRQIMSEQWNCFWNKWNRFWKPPSVHGSSFSSAVPNMAY